MPLDKFEIIEEEDGVPTFYLNDQKIHGVQSWSYHQDCPIVAELTLKIFVKSFVNANSVEG